MRRMAANMNFLRTQYEYSYDRHMAAAGCPHSLPEVCQDTTFDIDMLRIQCLPVGFLPNLCYDIVVPAGRRGIDMYASN